MTIRLATCALAVLAVALGTVARAGVPHITYDVVVDKGGHLMHGSSGTSVVYADSGSYIATFPVDVTSCVYVATLGRALNSGGNSEPGGYVTVVRSSGFPNGVFLQTFGPRGLRRPRPFHLLVTC